MPCISEVLVAKVGTTLEANDVLEPLSLHCILRHEVDSLKS